MPRENKITLPNRVRLAAHFAMTNRLEWIEAVCHSAAERIETLEAALRLIADRQICRVCRSFSGVCTCMRGEWVPLRDEATAIAEVALAQAAEIPVSGTSGVSGEPPPKST